MGQEIVRRSEVIPSNGRSPRALLFSMTSTRNKPLWPKVMVPGPLSLSRFDALGCQGWKTNDGDDLSPDAPNTNSGYKLADDPWDNRLYATAYTKFASDARSGSGEWGMNALTWRKALGTLTQLALTSATSVAAIAKTSQAAWNYLRNNPATCENRLKGRRRWLANKRAKDAKERRRISNEIYLLEQVSGLLLAYRYAISPLMSDIYQTMSMLSEPAPDENSTISHRVSRRRVTPFNWDYGYPYSSYGERGAFTESVVLKCTTSVSNPNLHLATRLGLTNPLYWLWDSMPWSFVVDWWFGVGNFLDSFSATLGLELRDSSVTRTRTYAGEYFIQKDFPQTYVFRGPVKHKLKQRVVGSLPFPTAVPYGNGLGIQRAQNALGLIGQMISKKSRT